MNNRRLKNSIRAGRLFALAMMLCLLGVGKTARCDQLPEDAKQLLSDMEQKVAAIKKKARDDIKALTEKIIASLQQLQDDYTQSGKLEEAAAIRERIRVLRIGPLVVQPDPGTLTTLRGKIGQSFYFEVTGRTTGSVWGSDVYTDDSDLGTAAVHAGILKDGQKGIVKVTIVAGKEAYAGTSQNGVTTRDYQNWEGSYFLEAVK